MQNYVEGTIEVTYVFSGVSAKTQRPYLQVSDGIEAKFLSLSPDLSIETFTGLERGDVVSLRIRSFPISGRSVVLSRD